ncbi:MAG: RNA polymerase sigma factor [Planctomycetes bacterium]|nr:RNA polymerase sigma factor [Planctomycetota bacterium]
MSVTQVDPDGEAGALVRRAADGDREALECLFARHVGALHAWLRLHAGRLVLARESVADLAQSACREVLEDLREHSYTDEASFRAWLFTAARRKVLDRARYHRRLRRDARRDVGAEAAADALDPARLLEQYATFCSPSGVAMAHEEAERIEAAFAQLPDEYREVITQAHLIGASRAEIGRAMGRSEGAVKVLLHRALARLSRLLRAGETDASA